MNTPYSKDLKLAKEAYKNGDLKTSSEHYNNMYETYTKYMAQCGDDVNKRLKVFSFFNDNDQLAKFTDQEVYGITDYMREQYYLTNF